MYIKILKQLYKGTNTNLELHLQGAPNFRVAELDVYGVAQPTVRSFFSV